MAVPAFSAKGTANAVTTNAPAPSYPAGVAANDIVLLVVCKMGGTTSAITTPTNFNVLFTKQILTAGAAVAGVLGVYWRRAAGALSGAITITTAGSTGASTVAAAQTYRITGCGTTGNPFSTSNSNAGVSAASSAAVDPSVTVPTGQFDESLLLCVGYANINAALAAPTGLTSQADDHGNTGINFDLFCHSVNAPVDGVNGTFASATSATNWITGTIAFISEVIADAGTTTLTFTPSGSDIAAIGDSDTAALALTPSSTENQQFVESATATLALTPIADSNKTRIFSGTGGQLISGGGGLNNLQAGTIVIKVKYVSSSQGAGSAGQFGALTNRQANGNFTEQLITLNGADPATAKVRASFSNAGAITTATSPGLNVQRHIAFTYASGSQILYLDGAADGTPGTAVGSIHNNSGVPLAVGYWPGDGGGCYAIAEISQLLVYDHVLTATEVLNLYNGLDPNSLSGLLLNFVPIVDTAQLVDADTTTLTFTPSAIEGHCIYDTDTVLLALTPDSSETYTPGITGTEYDDADTAQLTFTPSTADIAQFADSSIERLSLTPSSSDGGDYIDASVATIVLTPSAADTAQFIDTVYDTDGLVLLESELLESELLGETVYLGPYLSLTPTASDTAQFDDSSILALVLQPASSDIEAYVESNTARVSLTPSTAESVAFVDAAACTLNLHPSSTDIAVYSDSTINLLALIPSSSDVSVLADAQTTLLTLVPSATDILTAVDVLAAALSLSPSSSDLVSYVDSGINDLSLLPIGSDVLASVDDDTGYIAITPSSTDIYQSVNDILDSGTAALSLAPHSSDSAQFVDSDTITINYLISGSDAYTTLDSASTRLALTPFSTDTSDFIDSGVVTIYATPSSPVEVVERTDADLALVTITPITIDEAHSKQRVLFHLTPITIVEVRKIFAVILRGTLSNHYNGQLRTNTYTGSLSTKWLSAWKGREFWTTLI